MHHWGVPGAAPATSGGTCVRRHPVTAVTAAGLILLCGCTQVTPGQVYADPGVAPDTPTRFVAPPKPSATGSTPTTGPFTDASAVTSSPSTPASDTTAVTSEPGTGPVTISTEERPDQVRLAPEELILPGYSWVASPAGSPLPTVSTGQVLLFVRASAEDVTQWFTGSLIPPTWSSTKVERFTGAHGMVHRITTVVRGSKAGPVQLIYETYPDGAGGTLVHASWDYFWQPDLDK